VDVDKCLEERSIERTNYRRKNEGEKVKLCQNIFICKPTYMFNAIDYIFKLLFEAFFIFLNGSKFSLLLKSIKIKFQNVLITNFQV